MKYLLFVLPILFLFSCAHSDDNSDNINALPISYDEETLPTSAQSIAIKSEHQELASPYSPVEENEDSEVEKTIEMPSVSDDCASLVIKTVESSDRVQGIIGEIKATGNKSSILIEDTPKSKEGNEYIVKVGVNGEFRFETITKLILKMDSNELVEEDWLTGEQRPISFNKKLIEELGKICL